MTTQPSSTTKKNKKSEAFVDLLDDLFEELSLAIRWHRPSILIVVYEAESVRRKAEEILGQRLAEQGQEIKHYQVNDKQFDIPVMLSTHENHAGTVFFVTNIKWGGGKEGNNAYRALNLRRELFVENKIRVIFWLTRIEAEALSKRAPDFWAFRHRVVELIDYPIEPFAAETKESLLWDARMANLPTGNIESKIAYREKLLGELPQSNEALMTRFEIQLELAYLYWLGGNPTKSLSLIEQEPVVLDRLGKQVAAKYHVGRGIGLYSLGRVDQAIESFKKAIEFKPDEAVAYSNLAIIYHAQHDRRTALDFAKKAVEISPQETRYWLVLGKINFELEILEDAREALLRSVKMDPQNSVAWNLLGKTYHALNRPSLAIRAYRKGLKANPRSIEIMENLGALYQSLGRIKEAKEAYETILAIDPKNTRGVRYFRGLQDQDR